jgi:Asp/Glu/hydantoin racemase
MRNHDFNPIDLFSLYMKVVGVPTLEELPCDDPALKGKKLGIINGASWITLWSNYFGAVMLPGVKLINVGNEAVQLNFMEAHRKGEPYLPEINIDLFLEYAEHLVMLCGVDAIMISCSTMNRAADAVRGAMAQHGVPVVQIDEAMMVQAVNHGGKILTAATHGPTVKSTQALLEETAQHLGKEVSFTGVTIEKAFRFLGEGNIEKHNEIIAQAIREKVQQEKIDIVVLAQLSMTVFKLSYADCVEKFGVPVLTSGETGFQRAGEVLRSTRAKG